MINHTVNHIFIIFLYILNEVGMVGMVGLLYGLGSRPWIRNHNGFAVPNWQTPLPSALATASGHSGLPERQSVEKMTSNFDK